MTILEKNRFVGVAFLVLAAFHLATLGLGLLGYSLAYPFIKKTSETASSKFIENDSQDPTRVEVVPGSSPGFPGFAPKPNGVPTPQPTPISKAEIEAQRTMTMIYILLGVQFAILVFIAFAGFTVVNVRAGGRSLGIVASLFLLFFYPLGTLLSIGAIWFLTGDECLELYAEVEKDKRSPQSII
jgi:hypothetical protein